MNREILKLSSKDKLQKLKENQLEEIKLKLKNELKRLSEIKQPKDGDKGADGYTPIKNKDYFDGKDGKDGYTPIKGVDYFDGAKGERGEKGLKGEKGEKGEKGDDGITTIIKQFKDLSPEELVEKLESLKGDNRLDAKAIKNLDNYISTVYLGGGSGGGAVSSVDGQTGDVDLSGNYQPLEDQRLSTTNDVEFNTIGLNTSYTPTGLEGISTEYWDEADGTVTTVLKNGTKLQNGQEIHVYGKAQGNILNGELVQKAGVQGNHILLKKVVVAEVLAEPHLLRGVATQNIANGDFGYVTKIGKVNGVYTTGWSVDDDLWLDNITGQPTNVEPTEPDRRIHIGEVVKLATGASENGIINIDIHIGDRLEDLDNVDGLAPDTTGDLLTWNETLGVWERNSYNITDRVAKSGDTMTGDLIVPDEAYGVGWNNSLEVPTKNAIYDKIQTLPTTSFIPIIDTEAVVQATTPTSGTIAFSTDSLFFWIADGVSWNRASLKMYSYDNTDMGVETENSKDGYYATFITDKKLYNVVLQGYNGTPVNGAIRIDTTQNPDTLEIYMRDTGWYTIIYDMTTQYGDFRHTPIDEQIYVWRGDSVRVATNDQPYVREYKVDMGAYPSFLIINGGTF